MVAPVVWLLLEHVRIGRRARLLVRASCGCVQMVRCETIPEFALTTIRTFFFGRKCLLPQLGQRMDAVQFLSGWCLGNFVVFVENIGYIRV